MSDIEQTLLTSAFVTLIGVFLGIAYHATSPGFRLLNTSFAVMLIFGVVGSWGQTMSSFTNPFWQNVTHYGFLVLVPLGFCMMHWSMRLVSPLRQVKKRLAR